MDSPQTQLVQVEAYELVQGRKAFIAAVEALVNRTQKEGHPGLLSFQFFTSAADETAGAVITYSDAAAWMEHQRLTFLWEELPQFQATVALKQKSFYGPLNEETETWLKNAKIPYTHYDQPAAGFFSQP